MQKNTKESPEQQRENDALKNYSPIKPGFKGTIPGVTKERVVQGVASEELKQPVPEENTDPVEEEELNAELPENQEEEVEETTEEEQTEEAQEEEEAVEEDMTVAELKEALDNAGVEYPSSALKADLRALYIEHVAE